MHLYISYMSSKERFSENMSKVTEEHPCQGVNSVKCECNFIEVTLQVFYFNF